MVSRLDRFERDFPKYYLFLTTVIFVVVSFLFLACSYFFSGTYRIVFIVVGLVVAHLLSVTVPLNADWYWRSLEEEEGKE